MKDQSPEEKCVNLPPVPGTTEQSSPETAAVTVEVTEELRVEDEQKSQLAVVRIVDSSTPHPAEEMVAKFYDPLYFPDDQDPAETDDPFYSVDLAYTHESAAYRQLTDLQGLIIPRFYGCFTLDFPTRYGRPRTVRLILSQYITGACPMHELDPTHFSKRDRQTILKGIVDAESEIYARDLHHEDFYPRNILITSAEGSPRVWVIDFGHTVFGRMGLGDPELDREWFSGMYISPLLRWTDEKDQQWPFEDWVDWDWQPWLEKMYEYTKPMITESQWEKFLALEIAAAKRREAGEPEEEPSSPVW